MSTGMIIIARECGFFETIAPTTAKGITAGLLAPVPIVGVATAGGTTSITLQANASTVTGETRYVGRKIKILAGAGAGQVSTITAYNGGTLVASAVFAVSTSGTPTYRIESEFDSMQAQEALIVVETNPIRFRTDGVAPLAGTGMYLAAGQSMLIKGIETLRKFKCIDTAAGASSVTVHTYF